MYIYILVFLVKYSIFFIVFFLNDLRIYAAEKIEENGQNFTFFKIH